MRKGDCALLTVQVVVLSTALLLALLLNLALKPSFSAKLNTVFMVIGVVGGLLFYGIGLAECTGNLVISVVRTPYYVLRMFLGLSDLPAIQNSKTLFPEGSDIGEVCFWIAHMLAFYSITSAVMTTLGAGILRYLRFLLSRHGDLTLIYGIRDDSIALAKECLHEKNAVVFVAENVSDDLIRELNNKGMSVASGFAAVHSEPRFVRKLHLKKRKITVYAMEEDADLNLYYALQLRDAMEKIGVPAENTEISLPGEEEILAAMLQTSEKSYGYGYVNVYDPSELTARALIRTCPPWDFVSFGPDGRAKEDFSCIVVGFGSHGQAVLRQLVMNGQFAGSSFRAAVFSTGFQNETGFILSDCPALLENYDISCVAADARSREFYGFVESHLSTLKLIALCTGSDALNSEIADNLMLFLKHRQAEQICVVQCGENGVRYQKEIGSPIIRTDIYTRAFLSARDADRGAIILNASYDPSPRSDWEKWVSCDSFSKMSSRASADFFPAFLRAAGVSREQVLSEGWNLTEEQKKNLGETEHLRWCAFHYAMGYTAMSREQFEKNALKWAQCQKEGVPCPVKISKDARARRHACLVPWEELDELSERENELTGRETDYQQMDINNVLAVPKLLSREAGPPKDSD